MIYIYTAAVTLLALLLYMGFCMAAAQARGKYAIKAPVPPPYPPPHGGGRGHFERAYRVQMNTAEQMAFFQPALWLCAVLLSDIGAAVGGLVWVIGRAVYAASYLEAPHKRGPGVMITMLGQTGLFLGALYGLVRAALG